MGTANFVLFGVCAFFALFGAVATVAAKRPLRGAVALLTNIIALAGLYLTLSAHLLAVIQLLVYAGAVVVLFVFVIMLIGPAAQVEGKSEGLAGRALSIAIMTMVTGTIAFAVSDAVGNWYAIHRNPAYGTIEAVGAELYSRALVPFEIVSITLLVAIVGAIAVARHRTADEIVQAKAVHAKALEVRAEAEANKEAAAEAAAGAH